MLQKNKWLFISLLLAFVLSGCAPLEFVIPWVTIATVESTGPTEPIEEYLLSESCPAPVAGTELLKNSRNGYCLLHPEEYAVVRANQFQTSLLIGGWLNVADPRLDIMVEDARGRTAEEVADELQFDYTPGEDIVRTNITVAGQEAVVLDNVPGQEFSRRVVFIHAGRLYHLIFMPANANLGEIYERMETLYETVIDSFTLIPVVEPAADDPASICPEPTGDLQLLVNEREGYCALYLDGYVVEQPVDGITLLVVDGLLDAIHARAHIEVEDALGRTAEEVAMAVAEEFEAAGAEVSFGVLVGGAPGWQVDNVPGQDVNRQVFVVYNGRLYRFLFAPADPERPEVYAQMEQLYETVIHSFTFIPPTAPMGIPRPSSVGDKAILAWEGYTDLGDGDATQCKLLTITQDGEVRYGLCGGAETATIATGYVPMHWDEIKVRFAPFFYVDENESVSFQGSGDVEGEAWQRAIVAYARTSYGEAATGPVSASVRTAMSWWLGETSEQPGFCKHLIVLDYGYAYANVDPCEGGETASSAGGWLETSEMQTFDALLYDRAPFYQEDNYFSGQGTEAMSEMESVALSAWAEAVYTRIVDTTTP